LDGLAHKRRKPGGFAVNVCGRKHTGKGFKKNPEEMSIVTLQSYSYGDKTVK
jgi:hypothetical protein